MRVFRYLTTKLTLTVLALSSASRTSQADVQHMALFRCAKELSEIQRRDDRGLLFINSDMAFASVRIGSGAQPILVVLNDVGIYGFRVENSRPSRLRLALPDADPRVRPHDYFLSYSHSDVFGNRFGSLGRDLVPDGRAPSDFRPAERVRLTDNQLFDALMNVISYELTRLRELTRNGKLNKSELLSGNLSMCRLRHDEDWPVVRQIERQIRELEYVSRPVGGASRLPASLE